MISFSVSDMTCAHCVSAITQAVMGVDPGARLNIDLATHRVDIDPTGTDAAALGVAIQAAGFTPVAIDQPNSPALTAGAPARKGCCCG